MRGDNDGWRVFRALRHPNYRLFFGGQLISVIGTFLTNTAMGWLASTLTTDPHRKAMFISLVLFASQIPLFVLGPVGGVWVDRLNRQKLLVATQTLSMLQSFALAWLALTHRIDLPLAVGLAMFQGLINAFDMPGRQAFLVEMVTDRQDLANAIALNSTMVHSARLIGPAAAGLLIHWVGMGWCFLLDGFSYLAVIAALMAMRIQARAPRKPKSVFHEFYDGLRYVAGFPPARELLVLMALFSLSGVPAMMVLMPLFGSHFGGVGRGDLVYGFLGAATGLGALVGAIHLASRTTVLGLGRLIAISSVTYAAAVAAFAISNRLAVSLAILPLAGWGMITNFAASNTILQTLVDDDKRGRVMSFFAMSFMGMTPFGVLIAGAVASHISHDPFAGARRTLLVMSAVCLAASARYWMILPGIRKFIRPVYVQRGILPEIAQGLQITDGPQTLET
ncbi:MAG: MFS transporter [Tepidisphaeraceae bacterium]|jgi:MFS family permease